MTSRAVALAALALLLALASATAGASSARPPVALTVSPAHVDLVGAGRTTVRITNRGAARAVVDVTRAGFALDLRGRPRIVAAGGVRRSAARWLTFRPRRLALAPGAAGAVTIASKPPTAAEPGDHDALLLLTTRRQRQGSVAVRMRLGVVVVVRAPGTIVRRIEPRGLRVVERGRARTLEVLFANRGNVTETFTRATAALSLHRAGRRIARLAAEPRTLRPGTRGVVQFRYRGRARGSMRAYVDITSDEGRTLRRSYRLRL